MSLSFSQVLGVVLFGFTIWYGIPVCRREYRMWQIDREKRQMETERERLARIVDPFNSGWKL